MEIITKDDIIRIKSEWPQLTRRGIRHSNKLCKQHKDDFLSDTSIKRITHAVYFLKSYRKDKYLNTNYTSLQIKEYMDKITDSFTSSGEFILALIFLRYRIGVSSRSPHVCTNIKDIGLKGISL